MSDLEYWNSFFGSKLDPKLPSEVFVRFVNSFPRNELGVIADIGCGNGRNGSYLCTKEREVIFADYCTKALEDIHIPSNSKALKAYFNLHDQSTWENITKTNTIVSVSTLYHISKMELKSFLDWSHKKLTNSQTNKTRGFFFANFIDATDPMTKYATNKNGENIVTGGKWITSNSEENKAIKMEFYDERELKDLFSSFSNVKIYKELIPTGFNSKGSINSRKLLWVLAEI